MTNQFRRFGRPEPKQVGRSRGNSRGADVLNRRMLIIGEFVTLLAERHFATHTNAIVSVGFTHGN